jgi:hypothetical protein
MKISCLIFISHLFLWAEVLEGASLLANTKLPTFTRRSLSVHRSRLSPDLKANRLIYSVFSGGSRSIEGSSSSRSVLSSVKRGGSIISSRSSSSDEDDDDDDDQELNSCSQDDIVQPASPSPSPLESSSSPKSPPTKAVNLIVKIPHPTSSLLSRTFTYRNLREDELTIEKIYSLVLNDLGIKEIKEERAMTVASMRR